MVDNWHFKIEKVLVTGGYGFIGSNLLQKILLKTNLQVLNIDKIGYASDERSVNKLIDQNPKLYKERYLFKKVDLMDIDKLRKVVLNFKPDLVIHLAAETHVDNSIIKPDKFIQSNIIGTSNLLEVFYSFYKELKINKKRYFKFVHVSTDEVFGSLSENFKFNEKSPYKPNSPYSASKAASDHLVRAWNKTYGLPTITTNCSNNFGPGQYQEKLIPLTILKCLKKQRIPIYGDGHNIRDWIFVDDHVNALLNCACLGINGTSYCIGANNEISNINIVKLICSILDQKLPWEKSYETLIKYVKDRPGHDFRYAIDNSKIKNEFNWDTVYKFEDALEITIDWYLKNQEFFFK